MWIARDADGSLYLYGFKPTKHYDTWYDWDDGSHFNIIELDKKLFPHLKWEDDPIEVGLFITGTQTPVSKILYSKYIRSQLKMK